MGVGHVNVQQTFKVAEKKNTVFDTCTAFAIFQKQLIPWSPHFARHQLKAKKVKVACVSLPW